MDWETIEQLVEEMVTNQRETLFACGKRIVPTLTMEDLWQPNDFPQLENNPLFRYEEGILHGYQSLQMALRAQKAQQSTI